MRLTVLGKYGPYPRKGGACSSYLVENGGEYILLDMGAGSLSRLLKYCDAGNLEYVFLSHLHYDHTSDLLPFRYLLEETGRRVTLLLPEDDSEWFEVLTEHPLLSVRTVRPGDAVETKTMRLRFFEMKHTVNCLAIRAEGEKTLVYTGDTVYNDNIAAACGNADLLLADCAKPEGFTGPHMTWRDGVRLQNELGIRVLATHLSPDFSPSEQLKAYENISVCQEETTYTV